MFSVLYVCYIVWKFNKFVSLQSQHCVFSLSVFLTERFLVNKKLGLRA